MYCTHQRDLQLIYVMTRTAYTGPNLSAHVETRLETGYDRRKASFPGPTWVELAIGNRHNGRSGAQHV